MMLDQSSEVFLISTAQSQQPLRGDPDVSASRIVLKKVVRQVRVTTQKLTTIGSPLAKAIRTLTASLASVVPHPSSSRVTVFNKEG
jgi:hypothetical protein